MTANAHRIDKRLKMEFHRELKSWIIAISVDQFIFHKEDKSFSQEASSLDIGAGETHQYIKLVNPKTNGSQIYQHTKTLWTGSGEDREVGGWEYTAIGKDNLKLTIWND
jgi:hypothetical protein